MAGPFRGANEWGGVSGRGLRSQYGVLDEADPFLSSLVFQRDKKGKAVADYLPLSEILGLPDLDRSQLVILSACHSNSAGLQAGEGINSMARSFRLAGTKAVLASR
jgi:CHAT domain-containing protein